MKKIAIHLGMGDAIAMAGLIVRLAGNDLLEVPCWPHNEISVKSIFINHPNIHVVPVESEAGFNNRDIRLGYFNQEMPPYSGEDHITWMCRQAGYHISEMWAADPIPDALKWAWKLTMNVHRSTFGTRELPFMFIHDDPSRWFNITKMDTTALDILMPETKHYSILAYADWLKYAKEIHVIDSSFLHLAESVETTGELFWHRYARPYTHLSDYKFRKNWKIID